MPVARFVQWNGVRMMDADAPSPDILFSVDIAVTITAACALAYIWRTPRRQVSNDANDPPTPPAESAPVPAPLGPRHPVPLAARARPE